MPPGLGLGRGLGARQRFTSCAKARDADSESPLGGRGLLHGLGFAGALAEVGVPTAEIPLALFSFNVGIELGQLAFVGAVAAALRRVPVAWPQWAKAVPPTESARWPLSGSCRGPSC